MDGVTGTMAWLSHVPVGSRAGLYGPANIDFRRTVTATVLQREVDAELGPQGAETRWRAFKLSMSIYHGRGKL